MSSSLGPRLRRGLSLVERFEESLEVRLGEVDRHAAYYTLCREPGSLCSAQKWHIAVHENQRGTTEARDVEQGIVVALMGLGHTAIEAMRLPEFVGRDGLFGVDVVAKHGFDDRYLNWA